MSYLGRLETILGAARTVCVANMTPAATTITKSLRSMLIGCQPHVRPLGSACEQPLAHGLAASVVCAPTLETIFFIFFLKGTGSRNEYFVFCVSAILSHCNENWKHIFPEMKLHGLIPNFYVHVPERDLYTPTIGL